MLGERILILAPHPGDEVIGCAAAIGRARAEGAAAHVLYLTTGVPPAETLWSWDRDGHPALVATRREEAEASAAMLGVRVAGFRDIPARTLKSDLKDARDAIREALDDVKADMVWVPTYEGGHQDNDVTNSLGSALNADVEVWEFAEYNSAAGWSASHRFPRPNGGERDVALTEDEKAAKRAALDIYASARATLGHVKLDRECFRPIAAYDYGHPPHPGLLFYQRFQWVPFRHPRVDYTDPGEVCRAITGFDPGEPGGA